MDWNLSGDIVYKQNGMGRSGHALKDLFTSVILSEIFNLQLIGGPRWKRISIIRFPPTNRSRAIWRVHLRLAHPRWDGISKVEFLRLADELRENHSPDTLFVLHGVYRIHLWQVHQWELDGTLPKGVFMRCVERLQELYWGKTTRTPIRRKHIAIHVRRGDVAAPSHSQYNSMGPGRWSQSFYQDTIDWLRDNYPKKRITLYSERSNADDLLKLKLIAIELGGPPEIRAHFHKMVTADCFVPACSSMSTWAIYLARGRVLIPKLPIKHFNHPQDLPNWTRL